MLKKLCTLVIIALLSSTVSWAIEPDEDEGACRVKEVSLKDHMAIINHRQESVYVTVKLNGIRDTSYNNKIATITYELRYGFLNEEQESKFYNNDSSEKYELQMIDRLKGRVETDFEMRDDADITAQQSETRQMVFNDTWSAKCALEDELPIYVIAFQPISVTYERFTITAPNMLSDDELISK